MMMLPILESFVASSQKFSSVTSSRLFFLKVNYFMYIQTFQTWTMIFGQWTWYTLHIWQNRLTSKSERGPQQSGLDFQQAHCQTHQLLQISSRLPDGDNIKSNADLSRKKTTKRNTTQFYLYWVSKLCDINWLWVVAIKDAERPAASHVEVLVFEKQGG